MSEPNNAVELKDVVKRYGSVTAVQRMDLAVPEGSFVTLLGPSGCGKTTTLRMVAGLEVPTEGDLSIKGRRVNDLPIHKRNLGLVFQNYALFPHRSVGENVAFGLKYRNVDKAERRKRVREALELVRLPHLEDRFPSQLSGGQQQRIALARAVVIQPDVLLLDEPLSALDANLREEMRVELKRIQRELGVTTLFVTHDQSEALALSDSVVVMNHGVIEQIGDPETVYNHPDSAFVASFLGYSNILSGHIEVRSEAAIGPCQVRLDDGVLLRVDDPRTPVPAVGSAVQVVARAEKLLLAAEPPADDALNLLHGIVGTVDYQGLSARYFVAVGERRLQAINPIDRRPFREGAAVTLALRARDCVLLPPRP